MWHDFSTNSTLKLCIKSMWKNISQNPHKSFNLPDLQECVKFLRMHFHVIDFQVNKAENECIWKKMIYSKHLEGGYLTNQSRNCLYFVRAILFLLQEKKESKIWVCKNPEFVRFVPMNVIWQLRNLTKDIKSKTVKRIQPLTHKLHSLAYPSTDWAVQKVIK